MQTNKLITIYLAYELPNLCAKEIKQQFSIPDKKALNFIHEALVVMNPYSPFEEWDEEFFSHYDFYKIQLLLDTIKKSDTEYLFTIFTKSLGINTKVSTPKYIIFNFGGNIQMIDTLMNKKRLPS